MNIKDLKAFSVNYHPLTSLESLVKNIGFMGINKNHTITKTTIEVSKMNLNTYTKKRVNMIKPVNIVKTVNMVDISSKQNNIELNLKVPKISALVMEINDNNKYVIEEVSNNNTTEPYLDKNKFEMYSSHIQFNILMMVYVLFFILLFILSSYHYLTKKETNKLNLPRQDNQDNKDNTQNIQSISSNETKQENSYHNNHKNKFLIVQNYNTKNIKNNERNLEQFVDKLEKIVFEG